MKPFCVFLTFFLLLAASSKKVNSAETVSFNFNSFSEGNPAINFQGDVTVLSNGNIQLTNLNKVNSVGRVLYAMPVRIWSSATGNVASFLTSFSFEMKDIKDYDPADGIIFFIAPEDTQIPAGSIGGGTLGVSDTKGAGHFVGVEFDTYSNSEYNDPPTDHVGIDVNSVDSVKTVPWNSVSGAVVQVTVIYDSSTKTLSVAVTNENGDITTIAQVVDLKAKLPERVKFGFSASGSLGGRQIHLILASKKVNSASETETVSFSFNSFAQGNPAINLQGDATVHSDGNVQLTNLKNSYSAGRVLYATPVRLWDKATGNVASFVTSFSFQMTDLEGYNAADGIIFFVAPEDTQIPSGGVGGTLGVASSNGVGKFVGVEFDSYSNSEFKDPPYQHIGIDVNTLVSSKTVEWKRVSGSVVKVTVIYDSPSKTLSVAVINESGDINTITEVVDLKAELPEKVKFGFSSASSVGGRQIHLIRSWSFISTLKTTTSISSNGKTMDIATA
ncbi:hypothetical protein Ahy_A09g041435 isoform C [Arachis hypogaea]|uniref:Legume lectin domain-containing protein n=1 Tax=Arachis hypogaea TaxID=3818 RepID=A0A445BCR6_ARAHY|nr:hypothetical protein Ahy_A09g041435 isoform C [Arachis hypogaea]